MLLTYPVSADTTSRAAHVLQAIGVHMQVLGLLNEIFVTARTIISALTDEKVDFRFKLEGIVWQPRFKKFSFHLIQNSFRRPRNHSKINANPMFGVLT